MGARRKFDAAFREGAVRIVIETGKPMARVARELGINPGTLENWVAKDRRAGGPARRCAGINRHGGGDERALHRRGSDPR